MREKSQEYTISIYKTKYGVISVSLYPTPNPSKNRKKREKSITQKQMIENQKNREKQFFYLTINNFGLNDYIITLTYSENLSILERIKKREYIFQSKLRKAYEKNGSELCYLGVNGLGSADKQYHDHIFVNCPCWCKSKEEALAFFYEYAKVDGVDVHIDKIDESNIHNKNDDYELTIIERICKYFTNHWYLVFTHEKNDEDYDYEKNEIRKIDLKDQKIIDIINENFDKSSTLIENINSLQIYSRKCWYRSSNLKQCVRTIEINQSKEFETFLKCYKNRDYNTFISLYFPDTILYSEGCAMNNQALTTLKDKEGNIYGYCARITLIEKGSIEEKIYNEKKKSKSESSNTDKKINGHCDDVDKPLNTDFITFPDNINIEDIIIETGSEIRDETGTYILRIYVGHPQIRPLYEKFKKINCLPIYGNQIKAVQREIFENAILEAAAKKCDNINTQQF